MSYQPEERYWTDYLRIALPVVGLLLMLGLFWFWAASLIGDEEDNDPDNLAAVATATLPAPSPSPSPPPATEAAGDQGANGTGDETEAADDPGEETDPAADDTVNDNAGDAGEEEDPDAGADDAGGNDPAAADESGAQESDCAAGDFCEGAIAVVTTDNVNVRSDPEVNDTNVQGQFSAGDEVVVLGEPEESDGRTWVEVEGTNADDEELTGYVTTEFLEIE